MAAQMQMLAGNLKLNPPNGQDFKVVECTITHVRVKEEKILFGGQDIPRLWDNDEDFKRIINNHIDRLMHPNPEFAEEEEEEAEDPTFEIVEEDILPENS